MRLSVLATSLPNFQSHGNLNLEITGITDDSRKAHPGNLFVAISGLKTDAHEYISQAIKAGAVAVLGEKDYASLASHLPGVTYIKVSNSRFALGILASAWYGQPSLKLRVIGVTGTEGKTTTCELIHHILATNGHKTGLVSTIGAKIDAETVDTGLHVTSPEALPLQELLAKMVEAKCEFAVLETTSMGLHQGRVAGVKYEVAVLTNITTEHLDYHETLENYREAKALLFKEVAWAILNKDDASYEFMTDRLVKHTKVLSYGLHKKADVKAENIQMLTTGTKFALYSQGQEISLTTKLIGEFNLANILAAVTTACALGLDWEQVKSAVASFKSPEGRLEVIDEGQDFRVFVDFAHTPTSVDRVLSLLRQITPKDKKLIAVYGAAGERDTSNRPKMGAAAKHTDLTIFTADDPRSEEVVNISAEMEKGAREAGFENYKIEPDRTNALSLALSTAKTGDTVAILGKGHEKSLAVKGEEVPWSDQETVRKILRRVKV